MASDQPAPLTPTPSLLRQTFNYLWRATWLRCPVCGTRPMFIPLRRTRSLRDWFTPLDGCPRCGYAYDREPGYFLLAVWGINYGVASVVGICLASWIFVFHADWSYTKTLLVVALPLLPIGFLFARHAKAYFLAIDHLADPHIPPDREDGGDDGGRRPRPVAPVDDPGESWDPAGMPGSGIERERAAGARREAEEDGV